MSGDTKDVRNGWEIAKAFFAENPNWVKLSKKQSTKLVGVKLDSSFLRTSNGIVKIGETLGEGGFGKVKKCETQAHQYEAIKIMKEAKSLIRGLDFSKIITKGSLLVFPNILLKTLNIQNDITGISGTCVREHKDKFYFRMPLLKGENLLNRVKEYELSSERIQQIALGCAVELQKIHRKGYIHGDVKINNFMIDYDGDRPIITIIDFDFSFPYDPETKEVHLITEDFEPKELERNFNIAPECSYVGTFSEKTDVYGLGTVFNHLKFMPELAEKMMNHYPSDRPTLEEVIQYVKGEKKLDKEKITVWGHASKVLGTMAATVFQWVEKLPQDENEHKRVKVVSFSPKFPRPTLGIDEKEAIRQDKVKKLLTVNHEGKLKKFTKKH